MHGNLYLHLWTCTWLYRSDDSCLVSVAPGGAYAVWAEWSGVSRGWRRAGVSCFHPGTSSSPQTSLPQSHPSTSSNNSSDGLRDNVPCLKYSLFSSVSDLLVPKQHVKTTKQKLQTLFASHVNEIVFSCVSCPCEPDFWLNVLAVWPHDWSVLISACSYFVLCLTWPGSGVLLSNSLRVTRWSWLIQLVWVSGGAATTDHQPGRQLCIWPVSPRNDNTSSFTAHMMCLLSILKTPPFHNSCSLSFRQFCASWSIILKPSSHAWIIVLYYNN